MTITVDLYPIPILKILCFSKPQPQGNIYTIHCIKKTKDIMITASLLLIITRTIANNEHILEKEMHTGNPIVLKNKQID